MVEEFTHDLTEYYRPQSPLELLQIQRIAFCRAKLAKLIDIEVAGRQMARRSIELDPSMVMQRLTQYPGKIKQIAIQMINGQDTLESLGIDESTLFEISTEIRDFYGTIQCAQDLPSLFPNLCSFLTRTKHTADQIMDMDLDQALMIFAKKIRYLYESQYDMDSGSNNGKFTIEPFLKQLDRFQEIEEMAKRKTIRHHSPDSAGYHQAVDKDLHEITELASNMVKARDVVGSYEEMKSWMLRSVDLDADASDRMMKYQTMLERRLSSAIGELLELRKHRFN